LQIKWDYKKGFTEKMYIQGVSKRVLQNYSKRKSVVGVTKIFALKGVQIIHRSTP
jgi:hypothetical protein